MLIFRLSFLLFKREIEELFFKPIIVSIDDIDKFEQKEIRMKRPVKNTLYNWLINCISEPIRKTVCGFKEKAFLRQIHLKIMASKRCLGAERN